MGMLLACHDGLLLWEKGWQRTTCPLRRPSLTARNGAALAAVDNTAHVLWHGGACIPCPHDVESLLLWRNLALVLSSNTDCLSIADGSGWLCTAQAGMYPQDMCLLGDAALICGGADGQVHCLSLPELLPLHTYSVPGMPQRIHAQGSHAHILSAQGDEALYTLLCRLDLTSGECLPIARLPGIPGAVRSDSLGGAWAGTTEQLLHFPAGSQQADLSLQGLGLPSHLELSENALLVTDPIAGVCLLASLQGERAVSVIWQGEVEQAIFC